MCRKRKTFTQWLSKAYSALSYNIRLEIYIIKSQYGTQPAINPFALGSWRWIQPDKSNYNKQRLTKMNRQAKQSGRVYTLLLKHTASPSVTLKLHHSLKGGGQPLLKEDFTANSATATITVVFSTSLADEETDENDWRVSDSAWRCSTDLFASLDSRYYCQEHTCTWSHGKTIFCGALWKSSKLPVQSRSGQQHILWRAVSVSVKGICYAVFTVWARFRPMRATQRAARFLWKQ